MVSQSTSLFTLGHSSRPLDEFLVLLADYQIECLVDVRRLPGSRRYPQYNADALAGTLAMQGIDYWYLPALCGRRSQAELGGQPPERFWTNASFARYAAYARTTTFQHGLDTLIKRAHLQRCCLLCAMPPGGVATDASSPITCWPATYPFSTSWTAARSPPPA